MSEVDNAQLLGVLMDIKGDIGALSAKVDISAALLEKHDLRITSLEAGANRQKGAAKVMLMTGTALGTIGGIVATWLTGKH